MNKNTLTIKLEEIDANDCLSGNIDTVIAKLIAIKNLWYTSYGFEDIQIYLDSGYSNAILNVFAQRLETDEEYLRRIDLSIERDSKILKKELAQLQSLKEKYNQ